MKTLFLVLPLLFASWLIVNLYTDEEIVSPLLSLSESELIKENDRSLYSFTVMYPNTTKAIIRERLENKQNFINGISDIKLKEPVPVDQYPFCGFEREIILDEAHILANKHIKVKALLSDTFEERFGLTLSQACDTRDPFVRQSRKYGRTPRDLKEIRTDRK